MTLLDAQVGSMSPPAQWIPSSLREKAKVHGQLVSALAVPSARSALPLPVYLATILHLQIFNKKFCLLVLASVAKLVGVSSREPKGCGFNSWLGDTQVGSPGHGQDSADASLSPSLLPSL